MKKLLVFCLPIFILFSCQNSTETTSSATEEVNYQPVKITGEIENPVSGEVSISGEGIKKKARLKDGKFVLDFELKQPTQLSFSHGRERGTIFLEPGDDVTLFLNPEQFDETLKLGSKGSEESNYLLEKYLLNEKFDTKTTFSLPPNEFASKLDEIKNENKNHLNTYLANHSNMNKDFIKRSTSGIDYEWAYKKLTYPDYHKYFTKAEPKLGDDYFSFMDKMDMNDEQAFKNNDAFKNMVTTYLRQKGTEAGTGIEYLEAMFDTMDKKINNKTVKSGIMYSTLSSYLTSNDAAGVEKFVNQYNNISTNNKEKENLASTYDIAKKLLKGNPAPSFDYTNTKGEVIPLESLKGKNIYIDVWATWCGPCMREIPSLKALEKEYHGSDDIVFMSVSIDKMKDKEKWLKMVDDKKLTGVQLMADKDWKSSICEEYSIKGIPRFILIDKEGKILDKNAPRPSSDEIKTILADLAKPSMTSMK